VVDGAGEFYIDGVMFDNLTFNDVIQVKLGTTEEWVIRNASSKSSGGPENEEHPFHIHVNDFVVVEQGSWDPVTNEVSNRQFIDPRSQADTVNVPWNAYVRFRTHFVDFIGRSVYHCHLLFHEDHGMMGIFDIVNADGEGAGPGQRLPTHQH
jgi:FtsP/CotA-like multicopper oxidase with cupredoxin domain